MKLSEIASAPILIQIVLDDKDTIEQYGEPVTFHTWDRQPMDVFTRLANVTDKDTGALIDIVKTLILDDKARPLLSEKSMLPTGVMMRAIGKVTEQLGK